MSRRTAFNVLKRVERDEAYSNIALDHALEGGDLDGRDQGLVTELVYGVLTWRRALDAILDDVVNGGISRLDPPVLQTLRLGAYQLVFLSKIPDHAAVDESVALVEDVGHGRAGGLVNAVLRSLAREVGDDGPESLEWWDPQDKERKPVRYFGERYSLPNWIANRLLQLYDAERAEALATSWTRRPPYYLRALDPEIEAFDSVEAVEGVPRAYRAEGMTDEVRESLHDARAIVQDLGAQLIAEFVGAEAGQTVLDGCAGMGGKTVVLGQAVGADGRVVAVDPGGAKLARLRETAQMGGLEAALETHVQELQEYAADPDRRFDAILIDAPCTGLGVLRRHPEIRWHRREADIPGLVSLQEELLDTAAELVKPGGTLVYGVCTLTREEGPKQVTRLLEQRDDFTRAGPPEQGAIDWAGYTDERGDLSVNPVDHDTDLFYAARLRRED